MRATSSDPPSGRTGAARLVLVVVATVIVTALFTAWWVGRYVYARDFSPTRLTAAEAQVLEEKLSRLDEAAAPPRPADDMAPEPYREDDAARVIRLSERELNGLIAKQDDVARRVAVDLSRDLVSVKLLVPFDENLWLVGGTTLRLCFGLALSYGGGGPVVAMRGVGVGGIPVARAGGGEIKNGNLVEEFGAPGGFWDQFAQGVEYIEVRDGQLLIKLRE
jgi:hypothetical protein